MPFPIDPVLPQLSATLGIRTAAVLVAPPGAGKTTRVPMALLNEPWLKGQRILMLEPRRLAARAAARYMARVLGESVGETIGYRVRLDSKVSRQTRVEVITEGVLTRLLQADPALDGVGLVIFDEFHERSLHADLGLALSLQCQALLREDLRLLVMSATLDAEAVATLLGNAPVIVSEGRSYPVETRYLPGPIVGRVEPMVVRTTLDALRNESGDLLVFLPGAGEIRRVGEGLRASGLGREVRIAPLYGNLSQEAQDAAILPSPPGQRKVVLASAIAQTSLTVEGVRVVIDSGLMRLPRFSPRTGMTRLDTVPVSRATADQRRGRAGRLAAGVCYRLWTEQADRQLLPQSPPEILTADLLPLALELAVWGVPDPLTLQWLDPPPTAALAQARALLQQLGALDPDGAVTPHGREMAETGVHPRLAHMLLRAIPLGHGPLACELAALLSERDIFRSDTDVPDADLRLRILTLRGFAATGETNAWSRGYAVDPSACRLARTEADRLQQEFHIRADLTDDVDACGLLLAFAYPDRIAKSRGEGRFLMRSGRGAAFTTPQLLATEPYLVAAELADQGAESRIFLAAPISLDELDAHFADQTETEEIVHWDPAAQAVRAKQRHRLGALILTEAALSEPEPEETLAALLVGITTEGLAILPWTKSARQLQERLQFMHYADPAWPDVSDAVLRAALPEWLGPYLYGLKSRNDLQRLNLTEILTALLTREQRRQLEDAAPTHIVVPSGSRIPVDYSAPAAPVLAVRLQEMFGLHETPRIGGGRVPLTLHLLSPAQRPVQVTQDLASFWRSAYFEVRKDLRGRYPKHYWPEDPTAAIPTNRTRPRQ